jgi:hypothetical protein
MIATAPTFDTGHPAIARIRCYFDAFHHSDSHDYAGQWTYPAGLFADGQWVAVPDATSMARNNDAYARAQREAGVAGGEILALACEDIGADAALVRGRFSRLRADGSRIDEAAASYLVVRLALPGREPVWKVAVCLMGR